MSYKVLVEYKLASGRVVKTNLNVESLEDLYNDLTKQIKSYKVSKVRDGKNIINKHELVSVIITGTFDKKIRKHIKYEHCKRIVKYYHFVKDGKDFKLWKEGITYENDLESASKISTGILFAQ